MAELRFFHKRSQKATVSVQWYIMYVYVSVPYLAVIKGLKPILSHGPLLLQPLLALLQQETHKPLVGFQWH